MYSRSLLPSSSFAHEDTLTRRSSSAATMQNANFLAAGVAAGFARRSKSARLVSLTAARASTQPTAKRRTTKAAAAAAAKAATILAAATLATAAVIAARQQQQHNPKKSCALVVFFFVFNFRFVCGSAIKTQKQNKQNNGKKQQKQRH